MIISDGSLVDALCSSCSEASEAEAASIVSELHHLATLCHPNILSLMGAFCHRCKGRTRWLLALEFCNEGRASDYVARHGQLSDVSAVCLLSAVAHLHSRQLLHRGICPGNVLLSRQRELRPLLANFGHPPPLGYAAPEVLDVRRGAVGAASDVFGAGATIFFLLTALQRSGEVTNSWQASLSGKRSMDIVAEGKLQPAMAARRGDDPLKRGLKDLEEIEIYSLIYSLILNSLHKIFTSTWLRRICCSGCWRRTRARGPRPSRPATCCGKRPQRPCRRAPWR